VIDGGQPPGFPTVMMKSSRPNFSQPDQRPAISAVPGLCPACPVSRTLSAARTSRSIAAATTCYPALRGGSPSLLAWKTSVRSFTFSPGAPCSSSKNPMLMPRAFVNLRCTSGILFSSDLFAARTSGPSFQTEPECLECQVLPIAAGKSVKCPMRDLLSFIKNSCRRKRPCTSLEKGAVVPFHHLARSMAAHHRSKIIQKASNSWSACGGRDRLPCAGTATASGRTHSGNDLPDMREIFPYRITSARCRNGRTFLEPGPAIIEYWGLKTIRRRHRWLHALVFK